MTWVTLSYVFPALFFLILTALLTSIVGVLFSLSLGDWGRIGLFIVIVAVVGAIPTYLTARFFYILAPNRGGAIITLVIGSFLFVMIQHHFYTGILSEVYADYTRAMLAFGIFPWRGFFYRILILSLDIGRSTFLLLLGLSLFVEVEMGKAGQGLKGLSHQLWISLDKYEDWLSAWQVVGVISVMVFLWDALLTGLKIRYDKRLLDDGA